MTETRSFSCVFANDSDVPDLKKLWMDSFDDNNLVVSSFFENVFKPENTIIIEDFGIPISALYLLESTWKHFGKSLKGYYIYAVATAESHRGKGFASQILKCANEIAKERGMDFTTLVPSGKDLFALYKKNGFDFTIQNFVATLTRDDLSSFITSPLEHIYDETTEDFSSARREFESTLPSVFTYSDKHLGYAGVLANQYGRRCIKISDTGYAICEPFDDSLLIKEFYLGEASFLEFSASLIENYPKTEHYIFITTADNEELAPFIKRDDFALLHSINDKEISELFKDNKLIDDTYMALVLD